MRRFVRIDCAHSASQDRHMRPAFDSQAPKRPTNLSINSDLLRRAREMDINLSQTLEQALTVEVRQRMEQAWLEENRQAIAAYNEHVAANGVFSDGLRSF